MTTTNVTTQVGNFAESLWYGTLDSAAYLESNDGTAPAAADVDGAIMLQAVGLQDFPFAALDPETPTQRGDSGALARFINQPTELPASSLTLGASGYAFDALTQTILEHAIAGGQFIGRQPKSPTYRDLLLLSVAQAKSIEAGNLGSMWEGRLMYYVNAFPKGRNSFTDNSLPTYDYNLVGNFSTGYPWGTAFVDGTHGDTQFVYTDFSWPYRPILQRWTGDNAVVSWNMGKNIAEDSADNVLAWTAGVALTWVAGAPGAGEFGITEAATDLLVEGTATVASGKLVALFGWN